MGPSRRHLPDNTQHSQETDIRGSGKIRTPNPGKLSVSDPCVRPLGHRDRHVVTQKTFSSGVMLLSFTLEVPRPNLYQKADYTAVGSFCSSHIPVMSVSFVNHLIFRRCPRYVLTVPTQCSGISVPVDNQGIPSSLVPFLITLRHADNSH
jgi:hypothetical protein